MTMRFQWITKELKEDLPLWCSAPTVEIDQVRDIDTRSLAVFNEEDEVIALTEWYTAKAHHDQYYLDIQVHPELRRRGIGTEIFRLASSLRHRDIPFTARGFLHSETLLFASALGAQNKQIVPPALAGLTYKRELRPLKETTNLASHEIQEFQNTYLSMYEWTHENWSPVSGVHQETIQRNAREDLDIEATSIHRDEKGKINGFIAVYQDGDAQLLMGETVSRNTAHGERIIESCLRRTLDVLENRGVVEVTMDGHITDPHWFPNWIKLSPYGEWFQLVSIPASTEPSIIQPRSL